ncbi:permease [Streptococcus pneumoniae]|nr:permease [Streptococcus pneumoniae]VJW60694.1 permease [Streptococcus pneumoniae]
MKKSILTTLLFAVLYFLCMGIGVLLGNLFDQTGNMFYAPAFTALVGGSVYMILVAKVPRFGAITTIGLVIALFFLGTKHGAGSFLPSWNYLWPPSRWSSSFRKIQGQNKELPFFHYFRL